MSKSEFVSMATIAALLRKDKVLIPKVGATGYWEGIEWSKAALAQDSQGRKGISIPVEVSYRDEIFGEDETVKCMLTFWERYLSQKDVLIVTYLSPTSGGGLDGFGGGSTSPEKAEEWIKEILTEGKATNEKKGPFRAQYHVRLLSDDEVAELAKGSEQVGPDELTDHRHLNRQVIEHRF